MSFADLRERVIEPGLCVRCGLCAGVCPVRVIGFSSMNYPELKGECTECGLCTRCCPGGDVDFPGLSRRVFGAGYDPGDPYGQVAGMFVAHAAEERIRGTATSGGAVTAVLVSLLAAGRIDGAVVIGPDPAQPYRMQGVLATTADEIINAAQSKYCLTPSLEVLQLLRRRRGKFAVVGLPCQIHGLRKLEAADPGLADKIYCLLGLCCHCNMEPFAHLEVLNARGIPLSEIQRFEFRGGGWPGGFRVRTRNGEEIPLHTTLYTTVLNVMFKLYGAGRCFLCVDALAEFADLSFGDFWAHDYDGELAKMERCTLVTQRTEKGRAILAGVRERGDLAVYPLPPERKSRRISKMAAAKKNLGFARLARRRRKGLPCPDYGFTPPPSSAGARRREVLQRVFFLLRGPRMRRLILRLLLSRAGTVYESLNQWRKRKFGGYHGN
ncbi:MAG: Coenzyme F420 hydrogenase/dehydrogenase, beta subunit C-terminal domain [Desulfobulbaceae bacterium]